MIPIPDPELKARYREPRPNDPAYMATRIRVRRGLAGVIYYA